MKRAYRKAHSGLKLMTGLTALAAAIAQAQTAAPTRPPAASPEPIVLTVTGSRVVSNGNDLPTPVTVLDLEAMGKLQPGSVTEVVNLMPALQGSQGVTSNPGGGQRNGAAAYFNLRNMGSLRTLVMLDGFRVVPTINQNQANVDASIVPQLLLKRVDVVTGGVSAVYGSDAVTGVINFVTDHQFDGVKGQVSYGQSAYGDGKAWDLGLAAGLKVGDKGHVVMSYQRRDDPGIFDRASRPFFSANTGGAGLGTAASPYRNIPDQRMSGTSFGGLITNVTGNATLRDQMFTPQGTLTPFIHGTSAGVANVESGGSGAYYTKASIKSATEMDQVFARLDYDLGGSVRAFAQGAYSDIHTYNNFQSPNINNIRVRYSNPFLDSVQSPYAAALAANPNSTLTFSRMLENEPRADQGTRAFQFMAGLSGKVFGDYKWNAGAQVSQASMRASNIANMDNGRLFAAVDAVRSGTQIVCRASLTNTNYSDCVPLNLFGEGRASQAALDYVFRRTDSTNRTRQEGVQASLSGEPFSLWAGPVKMAVSGEVRRIRWDVSSNASPNDLADCTGVSLNCTATGSTATRKWFFNTMGALNTVEQRVAEAAIEADVPLAHDQPWAQSLSLNGAARYTRYNLSGGVQTSKLGSVWQINDAVTFRATRSRDIRAPNLFEMFSPVQINPGTTLTDVHTGIQGVVPNQQTSNPNLKPEKADTSTIGVVFTPATSSGFSLAVDYFSIQVDDVINLLQGRSDQAQAQCEQSNGTSPLCALIVRPLPFSDRSAANFPTLTTSSYLNIASLKTWGVDVEVNYRPRVLGKKLNTRVLYSYQPKLEFNQGPAGTVDLGNAYTGVNLFPASSSKKLTASASYDLNDDLTLGLVQRWRGPMKVTALTDRVLVNDTLPSLGYTSLTANWRFKANVGSYEAFVNVANLFNKFPTVYYPGPVNNPGSGQQMPAGDDPIGRYFTVGLRAKF